MLWFHVRQFARVGYFVELMVVSTVSSVLIQGLAYGFAGGLPSQVWLRSAEIGMWTTCTASAGMIGFQRFQGTLAPLLVGQQPPARSLSAVVTAASTFGLVSFPLSAVVVALLGGTVDVNLTTIIGAVLVWLGAAAVSLVVAAVFVLTPNAITYEVLLLVPVLFVSGMFGYPSGLPSWAAGAFLVVPLTSGVRFLASGAGASVMLPLWAVALVGFACSVAWIGCARYLLHLCLRRARLDGSLEVL